MNKYWNRLAPFGVLFAGAWVLSVNVPPAGAAESPWMAFNEVSPGPTTHSNVSRWSPFGTNYGGPGSTGPLKNAQTGTDLGATLTVTHSGAAVGGTGAAPAAGTPAYVTFNGYVDWATGYSNYNAVTLTNGAGLTYSFSGLNPAKRYRFKGTAVRGSASFTNRWTLAEITGAETFISRHTANVLTSVQLPGQLSASQAALLAGNNTSGDMVVWEEIVPNPGGTFSVTSAKFSGTIPGGSTDGSQAYGLEALRLEEYEAGPLVMITSPAEGASFVAPASLALSAIASNTAAPVTNVAFYAGATLLGQSATSPYSWTWTNVSAGNYALTAVAFDSGGLAVTSAPVSVNVRSAVPLGVPCTFGTLPSIEEWSTYSISGGSTTYSNASSLDAGVTALAASTVNQSLSTATNYVENGLARWNSANQKVFIRPTGNAATVLMATLGNNTTRPLGGVQVSYNLGNVTNQNEEVNGLRAYYSLTGATGSWTLIPEFSTNRTGTLTATLPLGTWPAGSLLRILWADDNGANVTDGGWIWTNFLAQAVEPAVTITVPSNNAACYLPTNIAINAVASYFTSTVTNVAFFAGATLLANAATSPYSCVWSNPPVGNHALTAVASADGGIQATSSVVNISVGSAMPASVAITSPADNSVLQGPTNVTITASAWAPDGVSNVLFFANGNLLSEVTASPYSLVWTNARLGSNSLMAVAFDSLGASLTSSVVRLTVNGPLPTRVTLVASNALYRWRPGTNEASSPLSAWRQLGFNDSSWAAGQAPFYYEDSPTAQSTYTGNTLIENMRYNYMCVFLRRAFVVNDPAPLTNLVVRHHVDDGFVMWLNGTEICRVNMALWDGTFSSQADGNAPEPAPYTYFPVPAPLPFVSGTNILAIQAFNDSTGSSDLLLDVELTADQISNLVLPPRVLAVSSPTGLVYALTNLAVTFTKPVVNVQAGDLLINGAAAAAVEGSGSNYVFAFLQPAFGPVVVTWAATQAIRDLNGPPKAFDGTGVVFHYDLADSNAPAILTRSPAPGATVGNLTQVEVTFSEAVTNVEAEDLLINGVPATNVAGTEAVYIFSFPQPAFGPVLISWSDTNGITDLDPVPTEFDARLAGASWRCTLVDTVPPVIVTQEPVGGSSVSVLTQLNVSFSESVTGVDAADLLVNGLPAAGVSGSGASYTFTFPQPNGTLATITWAANHGITDLAASPNGFDANTPGATWDYTTVDAVPPSVVSLNPPAGARVRTLSRLAVTFNEPVTGVTADALLINGLPALQVSGSAAGPYTFDFVPPATGAVQFAWAPTQAIYDFATSPNIFGGGSWTVTLDPTLPYHTAIEHVIHISVDGLGAFYLADYLSNAPALFPNFARMRAQGASTLEARADYSSTVTLPNHACQLTGRPVSHPSGWPNTFHHGITFDSDNGGTMHDSGNLSIPYKASTLDVVHDRGLSTAFYSSKTKFVFYTRSYDGINGAADVTGEDNGRNKIDMAILTDGGSSLYGASETLVNALVTDLGSSPWNYTFLHFAEPDYAGHDTGWGSAGYSNAVRHVDQQLGRILAAIDSNPALVGQIAVVLTADHGGGGNSSTGHSTTTAYKNFAVPLFVWGAGIPSGIDLYSLFANRGNPGTNRLSYNATPQPLRNGDVGNLSLALLGLPPIPGSSMIPQFNLPPIIVADPQSATTFLGATVSFSVAISGAPLSYQWQFNGATVAGQTNPALTLASVALSNTGSYSVIVTNALGQTTSTLATLTILAPQVAGWVELEAFIGSNRVVTINASDNDGNVLQTWILSLDFNGGLAPFALNDLPLSATHLSAKTAWHLRRRLELIYDGGPVAAAFTEASRLLGGDFNDSNSVDQADYHTLAAAWYTVNPAADIDGNGRVDQDDYFILANNWNAYGDVE